jgi:hypothetical protein
LNKRNEKLLPPKGLHPKYRRRRRRRRKKKKKLPLAATQTHMTNI